MYKELSLQEYIGLPSKERNWLIKECEKTLEGRVLEYIRKYFAKVHLGIYTESDLNYNLYQWYIGKHDVHILRIFSYKITLADKVNIPEIIKRVDDLVDLFENKVKLDVLSITPAWPVNVSIQIVDRNINLDALNVLLRLD